MLNYAEENNRKVIFKGIDQGKDQTYVLWGLGTRKV